MGFEAVPTEQAERMASPRWLTSVKSEPFSKLPTGEHRIARRMAAQHTKALIPEHASIILKQNVFLWRIERACLS